MPLGAFSQCIASYLDWETLNAFLRIGARLCEFCMVQGQMWLKGLQTSALWMRFLVTCGETSAEASA